MRVSSFLAFVGLLATLGCQPSSVPERAPATPLDPATTGTIRGSIRFTGTPPKEGEIRIAGDSVCTETHSGTLPAGDVLVKGGKVENAFVYVKEGLGSRVFPLPAEPVTIDQKGCLYAPHVVGAETGQEIRFLNSDATLHNVHTLPANSSGSNFGMSQKGSSRAIRIGKAEVMVKVQCDVHPWMRAYVGVLDHPYFAVTGKDGAFSLANVPAGDYVVEVWHERLGSHTAKLTVTTQQTAEVEIDLGAS